MKRLSSTSLISPFLITESTTTLSTPDITDEEESEPQLLQEEDE